MDNIRIRLALLRAGRNSPVGQWEDMVGTAEQVPDPSFLILRSLTSVDSHWCERRR